MWDWLTELVSPDVSVSSWAADREAAFDYAMSVVGTTSDARGWPTVTYDMASGYVAVAYDESDSAASFWEALSKTWPNNPSVDGWNELGEAWGAATGSATKALDTKSSVAVAAKKTGVQLVVVVGLVALVGLVAWKRA